jgi:dolichyl-phosphate-mannose-protein mannosyltransferase
LTSATRYFVRSLLLFTALTAVMTFPQVLHLADTVHDDGDPLLNTWTLAWVAHQLPRAPAHLFDANIFYPERRTLAFSETLLAPAAIAAPLHWIGVGPLLVYNLVFLSGFIVSGAGVALLVRELTGDGIAGIVGGIVFAFLPYRFDHYPHLQLQQTQFLPLALWAFHRLLRSNRARDGVVFGACVAGQILSCMYYGLFLVPYLAAVCGALLVADRRMPRARAIAIVVAAVIALAAVAPLGRAYFAARRVVGERLAEEVVDRSASWSSYLAPAETNLVYGKIFGRFIQPERNLFLGFVPMALALAALWPGGGATRSARIAYGLGLLVALDVSRGFNGFEYPWLFDYFVPFRALRIPARMGIVVGFSVAVLAGLAVDRILRVLPSAASRRAAATALAAAILVEYATWPLDSRRVATRPPAVYADIAADSGDGPMPAIFEFPASSLDDPTYMYFSTFHWQHLVNGYSGFFPPAYVRLANAIRDFPNGTAMEAIKAHGARYLVVHGERLFGARYETLVPQLDRRSDLALLTRRPWEHSEISVYRIVYEPGGN